MTDPRVRSEVILDILIKQLERVLDNARNLRGCLKYEDHGQAKVEAWQPPTARQIKVAQQYGIRISGGLSRQELRRKIAARLEI